MSIAFDEATLAPTPTWTALDQLYPSLVASYSIDRGRSYELDRVDTGRASVSISDRDGILDPTNPASPYLGKIQPLKQVALARHNPFDDGWHVRFRGFIEEWGYEFDPSQRVNRLTLECVDLFEIVSAIEMFPGHFGDPPPAASTGQVFFEDAGDETDYHGMQLRCYQVLGDAGIDPAFFVVFSGNIAIRETTYSPAESAMTVIQEAADAEFPSVGNVYCDRIGRLCVHGRYARFDPEGTIATDPRWDFHDWSVGDGQRVNASPTDTAHIRSFGINRGLSKIINRALATPAGIADDKVEAQTVEDTGSIGVYGIRPWSSQNLLTKYGTTDHLDAVAECKKFAQYFVDNYKAPDNRIGEIGFRSSHPSAVGSQANWDFLCQCDLNDRVTVRMHSPGGGSILGTQYFVEGIHEESRPLQPDFDDVTLTLDLSPADYFANNPFPPAP